MASIPAGGSIEHSVHLHAVSFFQSVAGISVGLLPCIPLGNPFGVLHQQPVRVPSKNVLVQILQVSRNLRGSILLFRFGPCRIGGTAENPRVHRAPDHSGLRDSTHLFHEQADPT